MNKISSRTILLVIIYVHDTEFKQFLFWWYENIFLYILKYILYITKISLCQSRPRFQKSWKLENFIVSDEFKKVFWTLFEGMLMQNKHFHFFETLLEKKNRFLSNTPIIPFDLPFQFKHSFFSKFCITISCFWIKCGMVKKSTKPVFCV